MDTRLWFSMSIPIMLELQWSHDLSAMDTAVIVSSASSTHSLQWSHDLSAMDTGFRFCLPGCVFGRFNGAMTSQPWIRWDLARVLSIRTRFNGAMTSQPWILARQRQRQCHLTTCFNGAMTSQPWIPAPSAAVSPSPYCFNGAMTSQPWIPAENISLPPCP